MTVRRGAPAAREASRFERSRTPRAQRPGVRVRPSDEADGDDRVGPNGSCGGRALSPASLVVHVLPQIPRPFHLVVLVVEGLRVTHVLAAVAAVLAAIEHVLLMVANVLTPITNVLDDIAAAVERLSVAHVLAPVPPVLVA